MVGSSVYGKGSNGDAPVVRGNLLPSRPASPMNAYEEGSASLGYSPPHWLQSLSGDSYVVYGSEMGGDQALNTQCNLKYNLQRAANTAPHMSPSLNAITYHKTRQKGIGNT